MRSARNYRQQRISELSPSQVAFHRLTGTISRVHPPVDAPCFPPLRRKENFKRKSRAEPATVDDMALQTPRQRGLGSSIQRPSLGNSTSSPSLNARKASMRNLSQQPTTPASGNKMDGEELGVGDSVNVPGDMYGTVKFIGSVRGKNGTFVGVELAEEFAARGKNDGDVDGYDLHKKDRRIWQMLIWAQDTLFPNKYTRSRHLSACSSRREAPFSRAICGFLPHDT